VVGRTIDARADVYAFGLLLFEMLSGSLPEGREVPSDLVAGLEPGIDQVFARCYCRLDKRYPNAGAVLRDLDALGPRRADAVGGDPVTAARLVPLGGGDPVGLPAGEAVLGSRADAQVCVSGRGVAPSHAVIARANGTWTIRDAGSGRGTWLLPAQAPEGKQPVDLAEKVGQAPLRLAEGMTVALGEPGGRGSVRLRFHDGAPATAGAEAGEGSGLFEVFGEDGSALAFWGGVAGFVVALLVLARFGAPGWAFFGALVIGVGISAALSEMAGRGAAAWRPAAGEPPRRVVSLRPGGVALRTIALLIDVALFALLFRFWWMPFCWFVYDWLTTGLFGATAGKWVLGLRVVDNEGRRIGILRAGVRSLGKVLSTIPLGFGYLFAAITVSRQTFHDFLAETRVCR
jgi:uncharacterized RDD family membrane protein YckC